jgi:KTSC domain
LTLKYRGPVSLAPFACEAITRSSFIERVCYNAKNACMLIDLKGTWYHYCEIDQETVSGLLEAESMGRFYNQSIKGNFDCRTHRIPAYFSRGRRSTSVSRFIPRTANRASPAKAASTWV